MQTTYLSSYAAVSLLMGGLFTIGWGLANPGMHPTEATYAPTSRSVQVHTSVTPFQDTLRYTITAGEVLIFALPDTLSLGPVESYAIVRAPALSWLVDTSFFWRTYNTDRGRHRLLFQATFTNIPPDTITVRVTVE